MTSKFRQSLLISAIGAGVFAGLPSPSEAADPAAGDAAAGGGDAGLQEIVVTASKRASTVQDTPISMTALSGDQLGEKGVSGLEGIAAESPGLSFRTSGPGQTEIEMRGVASAGGSSPTVGYYLDETALTPPAASLNGKVVIDPNLFDLTRVEVLRGPQGTLYGAGSMGGTVKLVTNQPVLDSFSGSVAASLSGTQGGGVNPSLDFALNVPVIEDKLAIRIVGSERYTDGWIDRIVVSPFPTPVDPCSSLLGGVGCQRGNVLGAKVEETIPNVNWDWFQGARASVLLKPTDDLTINAMVFYQRTTAGGYSTYDFPPGPDPVLAHYQPFDIPEPFSDTFRLYSGTINYDLHFATLTSNTSWWSREEKQSQDTSEALYTNFLQYYGTSIMAPISFVENDYSHQLSEELRLASEGNGPYEWLVGAFYSDMESIFFDINQAPAFAPISVGGAAANPEGAVYDARNPYHVTQYSFFGEGSWHFADEWKLTLGLRYFRYMIHVDESQYGNLTASGNAIPTIAQFDTSDSGMTPKINLSWEPDPNLNLYVSATKGFRPGGVNQPLPDFCQAKIETYGPDSLWDYEIGEKAKLFDRKVTLDTDFYYIQWNNVQQLINQACGYALTTVAGDAVSYGPEVEVSARVTPEFSFNAAAAYTESHLETINPSASAVATTPLTPGTPILNIPRYTTSVTLTYTHPVSDSFDFVAWIRDSYVGPTTDTSYYYFNLDPYNLIDLQAGIEGEQWSAHFFADNLTNKHAELTANTTTFSWIIPSLTRLTTNQPRTFGVKASYKF